MMCNSTEAFWPKRSIFFILGGICFLQVLVCLYYGNQKSFLFVDELFSYTSANDKDESGTELPQNEWVNEEWYDKYVTVDPEHRFEYAIPYKNQISDVHPPLFYLFLHTSCSLIPGEFSYWTGIGWNILFLIGCTIALYFLGKEIFASQIVGVLSAFLFGITYGGLNIMLYIRMYMLLAFLTLLHVFVQVKYFERDEVPFKAYIFLSLTLVGGALTHYYFLIAAFAACAWYTVKLLFDKKYRYLFRYLTTIFISAAISLGIYPSMWTHIFKGRRGVEAGANFISFDGYWDALKSMWKILDGQMFSRMLIPLLGLLLFLTALLYRKKKKVEIINRKISFLGFVAIFYFLLLTKITPYLMDRYIVPIYPLIYLLAVGCTYRIFLSFGPRKVVAFLCLAGFGGLSLVHLTLSELHYTFKAETASRREVVDVYAENYAVYITEEKPLYKHYDAIQILKGYRGFYYMTAPVSEQDTEKVKQDMDILGGEKDVVLYADKEQEFEEIRLFLGKVIPGIGEDDIQVLNSDTDWNVYLIERPADV